MWLIILLAFSWPILRKINQNWTKRIELVRNRLLNLQIYRMSGLPHPKSNPTFILYLVHWVEILTEQNLLNENLTVYGRQHQRR